MLLLCPEKTYLAVFLLVLSEQGKIYEAREMKIKLFHPCITFLGLRAQKLIFETTLELGHCGAHLRGLWPNIDGPCVLPRNKQVAANCPSYDTTAGAWPVTPCTWFVFATAAAVDSVATGRPIEEIIPVLISLRIPCRKVVTK